MKILRIFLILFIILANIVPAIPVAAISDPDDISIESVKVFSNIFENGDWLVVFHTNVDYGTIVPTEAPGNVYMAALYDGATLLASSSLLTWGSSIMSFWFDSDKVISKGLVWNTAYTLKLQSKPPYNITTALRSLAGTYYSADTVMNRANLSRYIVERMKIAGDENGVAYTTTTLSGSILNLTGSTIVLEAIPGSGSILSIFQSSVAVLDTGHGTHNETYQEILSNYLMLTDAESAALWLGTSVNTTWDRTQGDWAVLDQVSAPLVGSNHTLTYTPGIVWDLTDYVGLAFDIKSSLFSNNFTTARVYLYDSGGHYVWWSMYFNMGLYTMIITDNLTGEGSGGGFNKSTVSSFTLEFTSSNTTSYYTMIDNVRAYGVRNATQIGFDGLANYFHVSSSLLAVTFFMLIYFIVASVIYMVTGNGIGALAISIPTLLFAAYPLGFLPLNLLFTIVIILVVLFAYFIFVR